MVKSINTGTNSSSKPSNNNKKFSTNNQKTETINVSNYSNKTSYSTNTCGNNYSYNNKPNPTSTYSYGSATTYNKNTYNTTTCGNNYSYNNKPNPTSTYSYGSATTYNKNTYNTTTCGNSYSYNNKQNPTSTYSYGSATTYNKNTYNTTTCGTNIQPIKISTIKTQINNSYTIKTNKNEPYSNNWQNYNTTNINLAQNGYQISNYYLQDLNIPLEELLKQNNMTIEELNEKIKNMVQKSGIGTREGVVTAGTQLADILSIYNVKLPYISSTGLPGIASGKYSDLGVNKDWGTPGEWYSIQYDKNYYRSGMDCSGFISWALHNGGYKYNEYHSSQFENLGEKRNFDSKGQAGDILWKNGHVALITDVNKNGYTILHETENDEIDKKIEGLIYTHTDFSGYDKETTKQFTHIIDMSDYYNNPNNLEN